MRMRIRDTAVCILVLLVLLTPGMPVLAAGMTVETGVTCHGSMDASSSLTGETMGDGYGLTGYSENTHAIKGNITYYKYFRYSSGGEGSDGNTLDSTRMITFDADPNGRMTSEETVTTGGTVSGGEGEESSCTVAQAGSDMDVTEVSAVSHASAGNDTSLHYDINAYGVNGSDSDAEGSASAYIRVHEQTGTGDEQQSDIQMEDTTTVKGLFKLSKSMSYDPDE
jgi:hypothetical protein